jgi:hypothetical protein
MSKTNNTPNFGHGTKDDGTLADSELDGVTGGLFVISIISGLIGDGGQSWGQAAQRGAVSGAVGGAAGL